MSMLSLTTVEERHINMYTCTTLEKSWLINVLHIPSSMITSLRPCIKYLLSYVFTTIHAPYSIILCICILYLYWELVRCRLTSLCQFKLDEGYDFIYWQKLKALIKGFRLLHFQQRFQKTVNLSSNCTGTHDIREAFKKNKKK